MRDPLKQAHERVARIRKEGSEGLARITAIRFMLWFDTEVESKDKQIQTLKEQIKDQKQTIKCADNQPMCAWRIGDENLEKAKLKFEKKIKTLNELNKALSAELEGRSYCPGCKAHNGVNRCGNCFDTLNERLARMGEVIEFLRDVEDIGWTDTTMTSRSEY